MGSSRPTGRERVRDSEGVEGVVGVVSTVCCPVEGAENGQLGGYKERPQGRLVAVGC